MSANTSEKSLVKLVLDPTALLTRYAPLMNLTRPRKIIHPLSMNNFAGSVAKSTSSSSSTRGSTDSVRAMIVGQLMQRVVQMSHGHRRALLPHRHLDNATWAALSSSRNNSSELVALKLAWATTRVAGANMKVSPATMFTLSHLAITSKRVRVVGATRTLSFSNSSSTPQVRARSLTTSFASNSNSNNCSSSSSSSCSRKLSNSKSSHLVACSVLAVSQAPLM